MIILFMIMHHLKGLLFVSLEKKVQPWFPWIRSEPILSILEKVASRKKTSRNKFIFCARPKLDSADHTKGARTIEYY